MSQVSPPVGSRVLADQGRCARRNEALLDGGGATEWYPVQSPQEYAIDSLGEAL